MKITSKKMFFDLWEKGVLGNRTQLWKDPIECFTDCTLANIKTVGFRELGKTGGGAWERVPLNKVLITARKWKDAGRIFRMDDGCPDEKRTIQGEICRTEFGLYGFLDTKSILPMRPAIAAGHMRSCSYATCNALLDRYMDASSRDDLEMLLELYPGHVIEFTSFTVDVGVFPNRNTLFWETRFF